jgi:hypothetical protein
MEFIIECKAYGVKGMSRQIKGLLFQELYLTQLLIFMGVKPILLSSIHEIAF